jgi:hypothetical protein
VKPDGCDKHRGGVGEDRAVDEDHDFFTAEEYGAISLEASKSCLVAQIIRLPGRLNGSFLVQKEIIAYHYAYTFCEMVTRE